MHHREHHTTRCPPPLPSSRTKRRIESDQPSIIITRFARRAKLPAAISPHPAPTSSAPLWYSKGNPASYLFSGSSCVCLGAVVAEHRFAGLGGSVIRGLDPDKYEAVPIGITKEGHWLVGAGAVKIAAGSFARRAAR